jgi:hypothetical protein
MRFDVINLFDTVYQIGSGHIGVFPPQYGPAPRVLYGCVDESE